MLILASYSMAILSRIHSDSPHHGIISEGIITSRIQPNGGPKGFPLQLRSWLSSIKDRTSGKVPSVAQEMLQWFVMVSDSLWASSNFRKKYIVEIRPYKAYEKITHAPCQDPSETADWNLVGDHHKSLSDRWDCPGANFLKHQGLPTG